MSATLDLFDPGVRASDPATSHAAALSAKELQAAHCKLIVSTLTRFGPAGVDRIAALTSLTNYQVSKRMCDVERMGWAKPTGNNVLSLAGRAQREWRAVG